MKRWMVLYSETSKTHTQCILTLMRYLSTAKAIEISDSSPIVLANKQVYCLEVLTEAADVMLGQLCLCDVIDYRAELDEDTWEEMHETPYPEGDSHMSNRVGFAIIDGEVQMMDACMMGYTTLEWMHLHCGLSEEESLNTIRGSVSEKRIRIYQGPDFAPIDFNTFEQKWLKYLCRRCYEMYRVGVVSVENGAVKSETGTEWSACEFVGTFATH